MGSSNPLRISTVVDVASLKSGMDQAAAVVQTSTQQMTQSFRETDAQSSAAIEELKAEIVTLKAQLDELGPTGARAGAEMAGGFHEARGAAKLLGEELGLHMNRELTGILAKSSLLAPALSAAFGAIAVAGFVEVASQAAEKLSDLVSETFIYREALKAAFDEEKKDNVEIEKLNDENIRQKREISEIGLTANERAKLQLQYQLEDAQTSAKKVELLQDELKAATANVTALQQQQASQSLLRDGASEILALQTGNVKEAYEIAKNAVTSGNALQDATAHASELASALGVARQEVTNTAAESTILASKIDPNIFSPEAYKKAQATILAETKVTFDQIGAGFAGLQADLDHYTAFDAQMFAELNADHKKTWSELADDAKAAYDKIQEQSKLASQEALKVAEDDERNTVKTYEEMYQAKKITKDKEVQLEIEAIKTEQAAQQAALQLELSQLAPAEIAERERINAQLVELQRKYWDQIQQLQSQATLKMQQIEQQFFQRQQQMFNQALNQWLTGQKTFGQSMKQLYDQLLDQFIMMLVKMAEQWLVWIALQKSGNITQIVSEAHVAAAKAYASAPNPIIGAVEAAVAMGAVLSLAAYEQGGIVPKTGMAMLHAKEMVLPAHIAQHVTDSAGQGGGARSGDTHVHMNVQATDAASFAKQLQTNGGALRRQIKSIIGNGARQ